VNLGEQLLEEEPADGDLALVEGLFALAYPVGVEASARIGSLRPTRSMAWMPLVPS
jgi:hypothetical protein